MKKYLEYISTARKILEIILSILDKILDVFDFVEMKENRAEDRRKTEKKTVYNPNENIEDSPDFVHNRVDEPE